MNELKKKCNECLQLYWQASLKNIKKGYECLYDHIKPYINSQFNNLNQSQKEDVVQNALIKIYDARGGVVTYCSAWVRKIIKNEAIGLLRKEGKHQDRRDNSDDDMHEKYIDATKCDEDFLQQLQFDAAVEKLIEQLEHESKGKDDLAIMDGLVNGDSYEVIAKSIGRSKGAVATRAVVIRKQLQPIYNMYFGT